MAEIEKENQSEKKKPQDKVPPLSVSLFLAGAEITEQLIQEQERSIKNQK